MKLQVGKLYHARHSFELGFGDIRGSVLTGDLLMCIRLVDPRCNAGGLYDGLLLWKDNVYSYTPRSGLDTLAENYLTEVVRP